ncbi:MAG TPA: winged helix-turn-helix transcriptional regulator [Sphingomicrobium sp.]|nr:winged helix-turn-helix transcriptional regulator [Sphingomicrobium sp.]
MSLEKVTKRSKPETKRAYDDACGTAHALELIGERWSLLVLRELMLGPRRFSELKADLPGISANVLTQRLSELEQRGLARRVKLPPPASVQVYEATEWGLEAEPIVQALGRWAARSPRHDPTLPISGVSILLSFRTMFDPDKAAGLDARIGFVFGDSSYVLRIADGALTVARGGVEDCNAVIVGEPTALAAVVYGGAPLDMIEVSGDLALVKRFTQLFELPPKAA